MDSAVATVKNALRERRDTLVAALRRELPEARFSPPEGGYFMWVVLPEEVSVAELETAAAERGVIFVKGTDFLLEGGENTLRLAYSGVTPAQIDEGDLAARRGRAVAWRRCIATGSIPSQFCELHAAATAVGVAVLVHGGFWRARYGLELERRLVARPRGARLDGVEHRVPAARRRRRLAGTPSTTCVAAIEALPVTAGTAWSRSATRPAGTSPWRRRPTCR